MQIVSLQHAQEVLQAYVPAVKAFTGKNVTLQRMWPLMEALDNPQNKVSVVHIAGTSGKTSTSYYIASLLRAHEKKVGLSVSPHIDSVTERIQLDGKPISDALFCQYLGECIEHIKNLEVQPSYFELLIALAYYVFAKENVDYAVIETGMGGMEDGSNVAQATNKVCVITDIGFDHMHILGDTLYKIASQKAGIIHSQNHVFMYQQEHDVMKALRERVELTAAHLHLCETGSNDANEDFTALPMFQKRNWLLAKEAVAYIEARDGLNHISNAASIVTSATYIPGRMDICKIADKSIVMDGAHNQQKMHVFIESFKHLFSSQKVPVLLALKEGKEYSDVLKELLSITSKLIITTFATSQDLPAHSMDPDVLAKEAKHMGYTEIKVITRSDDAFDALLATMESTVIVTGSFYLLSQLRSTQHLQHIY